MSESFDPYHVWLGIPPESRPPTHYEMLGISPHEQDKAVIEAAMLRQSGLVRLSRKRDARTKPAEAAILYNGKNIT